MRIGPFSLRVPMICSPSDRPRIDEQIFVFLGTAEAALHWRVEGDGAVRSVGGEGGDVVNHQWHRWRQLAREGEPRTVVSAQGFVAWP